MSDLGWRIAILSLVALVTGIAIWRASHHRRGSPQKAFRPDLGPGVHFFSSETCVPCEEVRRLLRSVYGEDFREVRFEDDPVGFGRFGVSSVPTVFVLGAGGEGIRIEGVPRARQLESGP